MSKMVSSQMLRMVERKSEENVYRQKILLAEKTWVGYLESAISK